MPTSAKKAPAKSANPQSVASLKRKLRKAETERDTALWLHAELAFKVRSLIVKQVMDNMANPDVRQQLESQLVARMGAQPVNQMLATP